MDLTYIGYLIFVFPGFCLVWTYRHFTKAGNIGEFEYAAWSFLWGTFLFLLLGYFEKMRGIPLPTISLDNPAAQLGGFTGFSLGQAFLLAFPLGFMGALLSHFGMFNALDKGLHWVLKRLTF